MNQPVLHIGSCHKGRKKHDISHIQCHLIFVLLPLGVKNGTIKSRSTTHNSQLNSVPPIQPHLKTPRRFGVLRSNFPQEDGSRDEMEKIFQAAPTKKPAFVRCGGGAKWWFEGRKNWF